MQVKGSDITITDVSTANVGHLVEQTDQNPTVNSDLTEFQRLFAEMNSTVKSGAIPRLNEPETEFAGNILPQTGNVPPDTQIESELELATIETVNNSDPENTNAEQNLTQTRHVESALSSSTATKVENSIPVLISGNENMFEASRLKGSLEMATETDLKTPQNMQPATATRLAGVGITARSNEGVAQTRLSSSMVSNQQLQQGQLNPSVTLPITDRQHQISEVQQLEMPISKEILGQKTQLYQIGNMQQVKPGTLSASVAIATTNTVDNAIQNNTELQPEKLASLITTKPDNAGKLLTQAQGLNTASGIHVKPGSAVDLVTGVTPRVNEEVVQATDAAPKQPVAAGITQDIAIEKPRTQTAGVIAAMLYPVSQPKRELSEQVQLELDTAEDNANSVSNSIMKTNANAETGISNALEKRQLRTELTMGMFAAGTSSTIAVPEGSSLLPGLSTALLPTATTMPLLSSSFAANNLSSLSSFGAPLTGHSFELNTRHQGWEQALGKNMLMMAKDGVQTATIQMRPAELGLLNIQVSIQQDQLSVNIMSQHAATRDLLESALPRLREQFSQQGFSQLNVDISDQHQGGFGNHEADEQASVDNPLFAADSEHVIDERIISHQAHNNLLDAFA